MNPADNPRSAPTVKRETTSIKIDPELWKRVKIEAIQKDMELSILVEKALKAWLDEGDKTETRSKGEKRS